MMLELHEGRLTFDTHDMPQHLAMMERVAGPFPVDMARRAKNGADKMFDKDGRLLWPEPLNARASREEASRQGARQRERKEQVAQVKPLRERLDRSDKQLRDILLDLFVLDPKHRHTASQALRNPYFDR